MGSRKLGFKKTDIGWIPEDWQLVQIRDLCSAVVNGGTPSREKSAYWNQGNIRWLKTQEIQDWYVWDTQERITELGLRESSAKMVPEKTIIVAMYGATAGRIAIAGCPLSTNQACCNLVVEPTKVYYLFLFYSLLTHRKRLIDFANGAAQQNLNQESVIALRIPVPAVPEQKRIALLFGSLDHKIELNRKINKTLEEIAWAIFKRWFIDFEFPNENGEPYKSSGGEMIDSPLGPIPKRWRIGTVAEICERIENGGTPKRMRSDYWGGTIPWFKTGELNDGPLISSEEKITELGLRESSCKLWPAGTVLIALYASPTVGRLGILASPGTSNQACSGLIPKSEYGSRFVFFSLLFERESLQHVAVGAAQQNISQKIIREQQIVIPDLKIIMIFQKIANPLHSLVTSLIIQNSRLSKIRDSLLPKLMSGEIRVPVSEKEDDQL